MNYNLKKIKTLFKNIPDLIIKKKTLNPFSSVYIIFIESLCSQDKLNNFILKRLTLLSGFKSIVNNIPSINVKNITIDEIEHYLYDGYTIILKNNNIWAYETKAELDRSIETNDLEPSLKGPKNTFVENIQINNGLIKRRIRTHHLKSISLNIGRISDTAVNILYIDNITKQELINETYNTLKKIDIDIINDSASLISYLSEKSIFPTIISTERPDRCAKALSEGKIVILVNESPQALILPAFLIDFINPYTDEYSKNLNINITKILRMFAFLATAITPGLFISLIGYNSEAIPTSLFLNFAYQSHKIPFPSVIECIIMLILCEILRESDLRFPSKHGSAISILGALVIGDAAVKAGLVSPIMIIMVSFTFISSLIFTDQELTNALRIYRFIFLLGGGLGGIYGLFLALIFFVLKLSSTQSTNISYTFPLAPFSKSYFKNVFFKAKNKTRSKYLSNNIQKEKDI